MNTVSTDILFKVQGKRYYCWTDAIRAGVSSSRFLRSNVWWWWDVWGGGGDDEGLSGERLTERLCSMGERRASWLSVLEKWERLYLSLTNIWTNVFNHLSLTVLRTWPYKLFTYSILNSVTYKIVILEMFFMFEPNEFSCFLNKLLCNFVF